MKVLALPHLTQIRKSESGVRRVIEGLWRELPEFGIQLVNVGEKYDLKVIHAGQGEGADVAMIAGLYWTQDYDSETWEYYANASVIRSLREARQVIVPSEWVAKTIRRDLRVNPHVVGHGIDWAEWQDKVEPKRYALWNKNRVGDVCDPEPLRSLALRFPDRDFASTFSPKNAPSNILETGLLAHKAMKEVIKAARVYLSTTKETFGIGTLEALASGVPVLGFAEGGNLELVEHGVTGYLARPGDMDDLAEGFIYCDTYHDRLGANGREAAKKWTWREAARKTAEVYELALKDVQQPPTVAVIIPCFDYAGRVGRAIESVLQQTDERLAAVIVVDDGSTDNSAEVVRDWQKRDSRVQLIQQERKGVSEARNAGIRQAKTKYICALDADDAIRPTFLKICVDALEADSSAGIAYTGLWAIEASGREGPSRWPGPFDYDKQLHRQNQVPTCCVFRKEMWERLGGYKSRYLGKGGAGSEDAEFWLRAGAYGFNGVRATETPLFVYSWKTGRVSGDPSYIELDWTAWHPWTKDELHPFASVATPKRFSHAVRQYDHPLVSVIIPVGAHHKDTVYNALDSLEAQTFRTWEAVVVLDGAWEDEPEELKAFQKAYPYPTYVSTVDGPIGAGAARNLGVKNSKSSFLLFLDADDWLYPITIERMLEAWNQEAAIVYSDYVGLAHVDDVSKLAPALQERVYQWEDGKAVIGYRAAPYDCERAQRQPEAEPYLWCNVTSLVPRAWHDEIGGFDETLKTWEDVDYHWRMARAGKCYTHLEEELLVYRFETGTRRETGLQEHRNLVEYLRGKYKELPVTPCGCGGSRSRSRQAAQPPPQIMGTRSQGGDMKDANFVMVKYLHPNRGKHRVIGPATKTNYGYRMGGGTESFLVNRQDVQAAPHLFSEITPTPIPVARPAAVPTPPPPARVPPTIAQEPPTPPVPAMEAKPWAEPMASKVPLDLQSLPGITPSIAKAFETDGINTLDAILNTGEEGLQKFKGIGPSRAKAILTAAKAARETGA